MERAAEEARNAGGTAQRIEEWGKRGEPAAGEAQLQRLHALDPLAAESAHPPGRFYAALQRRSDALHGEQQALHEKLERWLAVFRNGKINSRNLRQRERPDRPLYVSRARKQPEVDFVNEQQAAAKRSQRVAASAALAQARIGRLQKAFTVIEHQATGAGNPL